MRLLDLTSGVYNEIVGHQIGTGMRPKESNFYSYSNWKHPSKHFSKIGQQFFCLHDILRALQILLTVRLSGYV